MFKSFNLISLFFLILHPLFSDMGAIVASGDVELSETSQKAIILYNGQEEILILGTDIQATKTAPAIRFIPLPAEPSISLAAPDCFAKVMSLTKKYDLKYLHQMRGSTTYRGSVELKFHRKLGAHDITVVKIVNTTDFRKWVNDFFKKKNATVQEKYPQIEAVVADYVQRGLNYFVFDYVELSKEIQSIEPVMYKFKSPYIYYPLKTSNIFGGKGEIDLITLAPKVRNEFFIGLRPFLISTSAKISIAEAQELYAEAKLFFQEKPIILQAIKYRG
jgi:hypothetical protein